MTSAGGREVAASESCLLPRFGVQRARQIHRDGRMGT